MPATWLVRCPGVRRLRPGSERGSSAWIESRFGQLGLIDPDDLPGRADAEIDDDDDLRELIQRFSTGAFADRKPLQIEAPFALVLAGQVVRGRIDAVYADDDNPGGFLLVDWKTNRAPTAAPRSWRSIARRGPNFTGCPPDLVRAAFYYVRADRLDFPPSPTEPTWSTYSLPPRRRQWSAPSATSGGPKSKSLAGKSIASLGGQV